MSGHTMSRITSITTTAAATLLIATPDLPSFVEHLRALGSFSILPRSRIFPDLERVTILNGV